MGKKVLDNLKVLIAREMHDLGGEEFLVPLVNPISIWDKSGRSRLKDNPLVTFKDVQGRFWLLHMRKRQLSWPDLLYCPTGISPCLFISFRQNSGMKRKHASVWSMPRNL
jgi:hypothetical protein